MLKIALRNVFRNRRRSLLSLGLIALGAAILFLAGAYFDETIYQLRWSSAQQYGHLQIAVAGYWESAAGKRPLIDKAILARLTEILQQEGEIERFTTELSLSGLIGTERKSVIFRAIGVEPGKEIGGFPLEEGEGLEEGDKAQALIGTGMAENLGIGLGDHLTVMTTTVDGAYNAGALQVKGIFKWWQSEVNRQVAIVPLFFTQRMLATDAVEKVLVKLQRLEATSRVAARSVERFKAEGLPLAVKRWDELSVFYRQVRGYYGAIYSFITTAIFILVFFSILEMMTMSFFERMREIGTLRAIGARRHEVFLIFLGEGLILGLFGAVLGVGLGWGLGRLINAAGLSYVPPSSTMAVPLKVRLVLANLVAPFFTALFSALVSTLYPALRAARTQVVEALRYV